MRLFDTHAQYDDSAFDGDRTALLSSMPEHGVELILDPGCDLSSSQKAVELAEQFQLSRIPVREALKILEFLGVISYVPGKGMYVQPLEVPALVSKIFFGLNTSSDNIRQLFEVRLLLETYAARYGADGTKFFETMVQLDLLGRVADTSAAEHGASPWYYYLRRMGRDLTLVPAVIVLLAGGVYALFFRWKAIREELRPLALLGWLGFLAPIAVYSIARVKLPWYIYPAFLPMAVLAGVLVRIWLEASPEAVRPQLAGRIRRVSVGAVVAALQAALVLAATVWIVAGEGKSIRRIVKLDRQRDVLLSAEQPGSFRGKRVYPVGPDGAFRLADATQLLTFYLAGAEPLAGGLEKFRQDASPEKLLVCVCPGEVSREWAEETGRRLGLRLIRFAGESALYGL